MRLRVRLSDEALRQIEAIGDYIARESPEQALRWIDRLYEFVESLADFPQRHPLLYAADQTGRDVRQALFGVYRVLYEVQEDVVYVLTVRHGARRPTGPAEVRAKD